ncbi:unnamed protein product [Peniophora sp. CBMAI 1063]|nr:unnamed protein product [Peniophora sp. CBMAI 1063]
MSVLAASSDSDLDLSSLHTWLNLHLQKRTRDATCWVCGGSGLLISRSPSHPRSNAPTLRILYLRHLLSVTIDELAWINIVPLTLVFERFSPPSATS